MAASQFYTMSMYPNSGCCEMSTIPNTHTSERLPFLQSNIMWMFYTYTMYLWLWQRRDSSICTIFPGPPRMLWFWRSFIVHTYFSEPLDCTPIADILVISTSWAVPVTGYWVVHFWRDILNLEKKSSFFLPYFCIEDISSSSYQWRILAFLPSIYHI